MEREVVRYRGCFICGQDNVIGLNLNFQSDGEVARTKWLPSGRHEGYKGIVHGGLLAAVLDEVMIKAALAKDIRCVTASMEVKYKAPAEVGDELSFEGRITEQKGRIILTVGTARNSGGKLVAEATGKYMTVPGDLDKRLATSLE
jgi:acyl-coenzyme A thioesterase PaaI-like protein